MRFRFLSVTVALLSASVLPAAGASVDLGEGLSYVRVATAATVPPVELNGPLVLDLRRTRAEGPADAAPLEPLLNASGPVRFVLVSAETAPAVRALLERRAPTVLIVAAGAPHESVDVRVDITAEEDLRAHDAYDEGTALDTLIRPPLQKNRRDEAAIVRSRTNGGAPLAAEPATPTEPEAENAAPPLVDAVLQRALHLHRGLKALGRL